MNSDMPKIVTRFAPSPTGFLHIGGARTALYNWLFARHFGGEFVLRIEDTDRKRSTNEAIDAILAGMKWLGLDYDGDAISQFSRADRHRDVANKMLADGTAYRCYTPAEELAALREEARAKGQNFRGDMWRDKDISAMPDDTPYSVRIKMPRDGETTLNDLVQGTVTVQNAELDDMVLLRSDGTPTYMLSVVVDDHDMGITHAIRGDDHLNNTFRQLQIYAAMNWDAPEFAHIPLIHGPDGKKLSKRHGALGVEAYEEMGFLPEAMRNYLLRLGWSHGDDEIIPTDKAIEWFTLENVGKSPARFDFDKLDNLNNHYLRAEDPEVLVELIQDSLSEIVAHSLNEDEKSRIIQGLPALTERAKRLTDITSNALLFCNIRPLPIDDKSKKQLTTDTKEIFLGIRQAFSDVQHWTTDTIKPAIVSYAEAHDLKLGKVMQPIRAAITGGLQCGDLVETLEILGQQIVQDRLQDAIDSIPAD